MLPTVVDEEIEFRGECDEVSVAKIKAEARVRTEMRKNVRLRLPIEEIVLGVGHCEAVHIVGEVVIVLVVPHDRHVGNVGGCWFHLAHEFVAVRTFVGVEIVSEVS